MATHEVETELVQKGLPCPDCGGGDPLALYSDGHTYCFSCKARHSGDPQGAAPVRQQRSRPSMELQQVLDTGRFQALKSRKLTEETCRKFGYRVRVNPSNGHMQQLAPYFKDGQLAWLKIRDCGKDGTEKDFFTEGEDKKSELFGQNLWPAGGRQLTIIEGEIDTMTVSQCYEHKYPVVGIPKGAAGMLKALKENHAYVNSFEKIVLAPDMDDPGQEPIADCAALFAPGKVFVVAWPRKDPNEVLLQDGSAKVTLAVYAAKVWRPDGIVDARDLTEECLKAPVWGIPWPWPEMTKWTYGRRHGETYTTGAGFGIGKTDFLSEVVASTITGQTYGGQPEFAPEACAVFGYEAGAATTKKSIAGKIGHRRFHLPNDEEDGFGWTQEELAAVMARMDQSIWGLGGKLFINDSRGRGDWESVKERSRYLATVEGVKHVFVDPISALVEEEEEEVDERKFLDRLVREAAKLAVELDICVYLYSHLTRPKDGPSHEEGGQVRGSQFRGSNAIGMFSSFVFGQERNTQADTDQERTITTIRAVKDRLSGNSSGKTFTLAYDVLQGILEPSTVKFLGDD